MFSAAAIDFLPPKPQIHYQPSSELSPLEQWISDQDLTIEDRRNDSYVESHSSPTSYTGTTTDRLRAIASHLSDPATLPFYTPVLYTPITPQRHHHLTYTTPTVSTMPEPITCHVLDTHGGLPASNIPVTLRLLSLNSADASGGPPASFISPTSEPHLYTGTTNADGRIAGWTPHHTASGIQNLAAVFAASDTSVSMTWEIAFELEAYWVAKGVKSFFPRAAITFVTEGFRVPGEEGRHVHPLPHWHVPLLVSPFSYTTYRGS